MLRLRPFPQSMQTGSFHGREMRLLFADGVRISTKAIP